MFRFLLFSLVALCFSCENTAQAQNKINADQLVQMLKNEPDAQLIDLRTPAELAETGKIEDAKHINFNSPDFQDQVGHLQKEKTVILYCAAGGRSGKATAQLSKMGFQKIYDYSGGMNDWKASGRKTVGQ